MAGRPSHKARGRQEGVEINLIPMMNLLCILVTFLLLSAAFVQLTMIETSLPARAKTVESDEPIPEPKEKLTLTVLILQDGFVIGGAGGILNVGGAEGQPSDMIIKKIEQPLTKPDGTPLLDEAGNQIKDMDYNWNKLKEYLVQVKKGYPDQYSVILMPEDTIKYETIIRTMDTARYYKPEGKDQEEYLFPNATLAKGIVVGTVQ